MKTECLEICFLILFSYLGWKLQPAMARHSHHHRQGALDCHRCPPGFGAVRRCDRRRDTECSPCADDHYSAHHSARTPCYPCSRCGLGLYVAHACTATNDTVCDSCHTYRGPHNRNFRQRCVEPLMAEWATSEGDATTSRNRQKADASITVDRTRGVPSSVVIAAGVAVGALAVILVVTCFVASTRRQCKRVNCRYPYEAVATQEAVML